MAKEKKKQIREAFRFAVFKRDKYQCVFCDCKVDLDAHHITDRNEMPNGGYVAANGITLCPEHHLAAENYHQGLPTAPEFHPTQLYLKIGSSLELATQEASRS